MFHSWVILHSYLINEPLVGLTKITRETFLWETNGQGTRNGGIIKEQLLSDLLQIGQVSGKFVKKIFILLVQCCMQRTTSRSTALMVESSTIFLHLEIPSTSSVKHRFTKNWALFTPTAHTTCPTRKVKSLKLFDGCLRADVSYFLCCTRATKEIGDVCTQASLTVSIFIQCASLTVSHTERARVRMKAGLWW